MRHGKQKSRLSMKTAHRKAMLNNMARNIIKYQRITTTVARAKVARRLIENLITLSKKDSVVARRMAYSILTDRDLVGKLFKEIGPLFGRRQSGFTRIIPLGFRRGDGASMCILELTERKIVEKLPKKKKEKAKSEDRKIEPKEEIKSKDKEAAKEGPKAKPTSKTKPTLEEEKREDKAKREDRKMIDKKGFMKNLRGFFHRKSDM